MLGDDEAECAVGYLTGMLTGLVTWRQGSQKPDSGSERHPTWSAVFYRELVV